MKLEIGEVYDISIGMMDNLIFMDQNGEPVDQFWFYNIEITSFSIHVIGKESALDFEAAINPDSYGWKLVSIDEKGGIAG